MPDAQPQSPPTASADTRPVNVRPAEPRTVETEQTEGGEPGPVEVYEPLEAQPPGEPVEAPDSEADVELDARAPSVMPLVWLVLGVCAVALSVAFVFLTANPPHRTPVYQAATPEAAREAS